MPVDRQPSTPGKLSYSAAKPNAAARRIKFRPTRVLAKPSDPEGDPTTDTKSSKDDDSNAEEGEDDDEEDGEETDSDASSVNDADAFETDHADSEWEQEILYAGQWANEVGDVYDEQWEAEVLDLPDYYEEQLEAETIDDEYVGDGGGHADASLPPVSAVAPVSPAPAPVLEVAPSALPSVATTPELPTSARALAQPGVVVKSTDELDVDAVEWFEFHEKLQEKYGKLTTVKSNENRVHQILRYFDNMVEYGPCIGSTRRDRWDRAHDTGLNPPQEIFEILNSVQGKTDESYVKPVFAAKITDFSSEY